MKIFEVKITLLKAITLKPSIIAIFNCFMDVPSHQYTMIFVQNNRFIVKIIIDIPIDIVSLIRKT